MIAADRLSELLIVACRADAAVQLRPETAAELRDDVSRQAFLAFADRHGVLGLVLAALERSTLRAALPRDAWPQLAATLRQRRLVATVLQLERDHVLAVLGKHGVDPVVLKGAGLATSVFREPVERAYGDIDLLFAPEQLDTALESLKNGGYVNPHSRAAVQGYRTHHFHVRMQRPGAAIVELHWGVVKRSEHFQLDAAAFIARSVATSRLGADGEPATGSTFRAPCPEHLVLHTVVELVRGAFGRIKWLVDIDRIVAASPGLDWDYLISSALAGNLSPALSLSLDLSHRLLGTNIPSDVLQRLRPPLATRGHLALLRPPRFMLEQRAVARSSSADLLQLWLLTGQSRIGWIAGLLTRAADDPLQWMWEEGGDPAIDHATTAHRVARVGKLLADQVGTYATGAIALFARHGEDRLLGR